MVIEKGIIIPAFLLEEEYELDNINEEDDEFEDDIERLVKNSLNEKPEEKIPFFQSELINILFYDISNITPASDKFYGDNCSIILSGGKEYFTNLPIESIQNKIYNLKREENLLYISN
ncbi:hypothetical protein [Elizabethkingia bruuniana]|uniref:hypothetical protein n=1 Tax=Elizabethkingia bruuniana TaxID=1756149 RepID=UPI00099990F8|nr:hypothetical protein [Elizabethkingia bruuniana]OPC53438.1 hypothetical protein BAY07_15420 [Elizabethkingia bruuniana]